MSTLIIKLTQDGLSQDFLLNGPGPLYIGSDENNDICVNAEGVGPRALEIKISNGTIVVKEIGSFTPILLNSSVLPRGANVRYREGDRLSIKNTAISFQIEKAAQESFESVRLPNEVHSKLKQADDLIRERKLQIKRLSESKEKKKEQLFRMEEKYQQYINDKIRTESEVKSLKGKKLLLDEEIQQTIKKAQENEDRVNQLKVFVERLQDEEKKLKDNISSQNIVLSNFQDEKERKSKEADSKRLELVKLEAEEVKLQRSISELQQVVTNKKNEAKIEEDRFKDALLRSEIAQKEKSRLEDDIFKLENERKKIEDEIRDCSDHLRKTENQLIEARETHAQLKFEIENEEENVRQIKNNITIQKREEENLKRMNTELRMELSKAEEKISYKRDQINNLDYKNQEVSRKLAQVTFELDRAVVKLEEYASEERAQEMKILSLREDMESLLKKYTFEKEEIEKKLFSEKEKYEVEIGYATKLLTEKEQKSSTLEKDYLRIKNEYDQAKESLKALLKEKSNAESEMKTFRFNKNQLSEKLDKLREEINSLESEKSDCERELARIKIRVLDSENKIVEDQEKARLEIEAYKREERSKMLAEKEVSLAEVAAFKQKAMTEVDAEFRKKQEEFHKLKEIAQEKADEIVKDARRVETEITNEAQRRLRSITDDVSAREKEAHDRVKAAQEFFKEKEKEAEQIIIQARLKSREVAKSAELELQEELGERKLKIKKFLTYKQDIGLAHIEKREQEHLIKLRKLEEYGLQKVEEVKRKELKKIAKLCGDEFEKQREIREKALLELNAEKSRKLNEVSQMKVRQEQELAQRKREAIEQINTMKYEQSRLWKEELKAEKENFNRSKKERIQNATDAVMNILVAEFGSQDEKVDSLKRKISYNLELAIGGQKAKVMKEVDHVIDFSSAKQKQIFPVLQKYALRVVLPVVTAIVMLGDIGNVRTYTVEGVKDILRQQHSASEIYAEQQKANWKEKYTYNPDTTVGFKETFFDNILYTKDFEEVVNNESFQNDWILKLNDYMVRELELSEDIVISYISAEGALISEMSIVRKELNPQILEVGFEKMREIETRHLGWLDERITDATKLEKFKEFRKDYFDNFYTTNYANPDRAIASEAEPEIE